MATIPRDARYRQWCGNCCGLPARHPPPKKNTVAARSSVVWWPSGSNTYMLSFTAPTGLYTSTLASSSCGGGGLAGCWAAATIQARREAATLAAMYAKLPRAGLRDAAAFDVVRCHKITGHGRPYLRALPAHREQRRRRPGGGLPCPRHESGAL